MTRYVLEFPIEEYSSVGDLTEWHHLHAVANIASQLGQMGLLYGRDFMFESSYITPDGSRIVTFDFFTEETAMMVKLTGVKDG